MTIVSVEELVGAIKVLALDLPSDAKRRLAKDLLASPEQLAAAERFSHSFSDILPGLKAGFKRYAYRYWAEQEWIQGRGGGICAQDGSRWIPGAGELTQDKWGEVEAPPSDEYVEGKGKDVDHTSCDHDPGDVMDLYESHTPDVPISNEMPGPRAKILRIGSVGETSDNELEFRGWLFEGHELAFTLIRWPQDRPLYGWPVEELKQISEAHEKELEDTERFAAVFEKGLRKRNEKLEARVKELVWDRVHLQDENAKLKECIRNGEQDCEALSNRNKRQRETIDRLQGELAHVCANSLPAMTGQQAILNMQNEGSQSGYIGNGKRHLDRTDLLKILARVKEFMDNEATHFSLKETAEKAGKLSLELAAVDTSQ